MTHDTPLALVHDADVPPSLFAHDTGLTPQRLRELIAAEDAYTRRPNAGARGAATA